MPGVVQMVMAGVVIGMIGLIWRVMALRMLRRREGALMRPLEQEGLHMIALQVVSTIGEGAQPQRGVDMVTVRVTAGARGAVCGLAAALAAVAAQMPAQTGSAALITFAILGSGLLQALYFLIWEARYDLDGIVAPKWLFGHRAHRWRDLSAILTEDPWFITCRFDDGSVVRLPKHIVGRDALLEVAQHWLRHDERPRPPHARTARS